MPKKPVNKPKITKAKRKIPAPKARNQPKKRAMKPCVEKYTIAEERALRAEMRKLAPRIVHENVRLANGEYAWTFARDYVVAVRRNRQRKAKDNKRQRATEGGKEV